MARKEIFDVTVKKIHATDKAWLVNDGTRQDWFPKSMYELEDNGDGTHTLTGPVSMLKEKGFV